jgi:cell division protein FtsW (lipid II flippase)
MEIIKDLIKYIFTRKKYWLAPVIFILLLIGILLIYAASSALAPYIYTLF